MRSIAAVASGRPAPRYAATGVVFVSTDAISTSTLSRAYTPGAIMRVRYGSTAPSPACTPAEQDLLRICTALGAEPTAHVGRHDVHSVGFEPQRCREAVACRVRV